MSILDTFYILFQTDAKKAAEDIDGLAKGADDVEDALKGAGASAGGFSAALAEVRTAALPLLTTFASIASLGAAVGFAISRANQIDEIGDRASKLRVSATDLDAFTRAAQATGASIEDVSANLGTFGDKLNDAAARPDGINGKNFAKWGIAFRDAKGEAVGAIDGILALAKSLEGLGQAEQLGRLRKLGIEDADTIAFLLQGKQAILDKMDAEKRAGAVTEDQVRIAGEWQEAIGQMNNALDSASNELVSMFVPALVSAMKAAAQAIGWLVQHKDLVVGFFIGISTVVTTVYLPAMARAAAATIAATWPFLAIAAAVIAVGAAFALAYEDVKAFLNGQPSLIGELAKRYEWFNALIKGIGATFQAAKAAGATALEGLARVFQFFVDNVRGYVNFLKEYWGSFKPIWDALKDAISAVGDLLSAIGSRVAQDLAPITAAFEQVGRDAARVFESIFGDFESIKASVTEAATAIREGFTAAFQAVLDVWNSTIGLIAGKISAIADSVRGLAAQIRNMVPGGGPTVTNAQGLTPAGQVGALFNPNAAGVANGQKLLNGAAAAPISGATPATVAPTTNNVRNESTVNTGPISINTPATDAQGIAAHIKGALQNELRKTASHFDDGVAR